jgi:hypothetical protein
MTAVDVHGTSTGRVFPMSETMWIVLTVAGWLVVMIGISAFAEVAKESEGAGRSLVDEHRHADEVQDRLEKVLH